MRHARQTQDSINHLFKLVGRNPIAKAVRTAPEFNQRIVPTERIYKRKKLSRRDWQIDSDE
jgi:hypothetical protein